MDKNPPSLPESHAKPETVSEKITRILGYEFTNPDFVRFIDTCGDIDQLNCLERTDGIRLKTQERVVRMIR
jgi:hypothetical protein